MIGLDAADALLVDRWAADGTLAALAALRRRGVSGRLRTSAAVLAGSPWPTFYSGQPPSHHGIYHDLQWRHERGAYEPPSHTWLEAPPFWRRLGDAARVLAFDVPFLSRCEPLQGCEVIGWTSHDALAGLQSYPSGVASELRRRFGRPRLPRERYGASPVEELLSFRDGLLTALQLSTEAACHLLQRPWDFAVVVMGSLHRGGHRLWDRTGIVPPIVDEEAGGRFDGALRSLYAAADRAVAAMLAAAGPVDVIVFSLHGMTANTSRCDLMEDLLSAVLSGGVRNAGRHGPFGRLVDALPAGLRRRMTPRLPPWLRSRLVTRLAGSGKDWARTPAFALRADLQGYVRVNLAGREPHGIVAPGRACEEICARIAEGLRSFRDADTGEAVVSSVERLDEVFPRGRCSSRLPDLVVRWTDTPASGHRALVSDRYGRVARRTPGRIPCGRSGNHAPRGFFIAAGSGMPAGVVLEGACDIVDLAPTVLKRMGLGPGRPLAGRVVAELSER